MEQGSRSVTVFVLVLTVGAAMRLGLAGVNPPNNSYDDHLEPIALYAAEAERPDPAECWQCYQPPVYYALSAGVLEVARATTGNPRMAWEAVQAISALASIGTLILCLLLLRMYLPEDRLAQLGGLIFVVVLPRALYTAASLGADALLVFFVTAAVYLYVQVHRGDRSAFTLSALAVSVVLAAWTKQSGLVALVLVALAGQRLWRERKPSSGRWWVLGGVALVFTLALADEAWRFHQTGIPLASNQHFEYRARLESQPPGRISASTFTSFLPLRLFEHPTLHPSTVDSFWTQLFARSWFDYEPRFLPVTATMGWLGRVLYAAGSMGILIAVVGVIRIIREGPDSTRNLLVVLVGFLGAALLQTVRFPHFSSMKALFVLPGISVGGLCFAYGIHTVRTQTKAQWVVVSGICLLLVVGLVHWACAVSLNPEALGAPTSPQWPIPSLGPPGGPGPR